jgi:alkanesulfonate monooxygenase SsuD/methylene tetrahydromethanopterin reductase-like flavin-dependent oxidoreductase (luciferase family)
MEAFYKIPFEQFERYTPAGTPSEVAAQLAPYARAGCKMFNLKVCAEHAEEEVALGAAVIEQLAQLVASE